MLECGHKIEGPCLYCIIGSEDKSDVQEMISKNIIRNQIRKQHHHAKQVEMALAQRDILLKALYELSDYMQANGFTPEGQECAHCNEIISVFGRAMNECMRIEAKKS